MRIKTSKTFSILSDFIDEVGKCYFNRFLSDLRNNNILDLSKRGNFNANYEIEYELNKINVFNKIDEEPTFSGIYN